MSSIAEALASAATRLTAVTETPRLDAEIMYAHALGTTRAQLLARLKETAPESGAETLVKQRESGVPLAYILGEWEFFGLPFAVRPPALVPRPETEHLVETVLAEIGGRDARVLDLCTGTGCVAVTIATHAPNVSIVSTDINPAYISLARENAQRHGVAHRVRVLQGDLFAALPADTGPWDVVCANPPYVALSAFAGLSPTIREHEDRAALVAGPDGLDLIRRIVAETPDHLAPDGCLALEIGYDQAEAVAALLLNGGFDEVRFVRDLAGINRIAVGRFT